MNIKESQVATGGSTIKKSNNNCNDYRAINKTISKISWSYYAIASASGFLGGIIASILANLIVK